jgi:F-type H+-transporting ATPase subunit b
MPILSENFWFAICFVIFLYLIYKPSKKILFKLLDAKIENIKSSIIEAAELKKQAQQLLDMTQEEIKGLSAIKNKMLAQGEQEVEELIKKRTLEMDRQLNYKKSQIIDLIKAKQDEAAAAMKKEFAAQSIQLVEEYFKSTNNEGLSDIEIAKLLKDKRPRIRTSSSA